MKEEIKKFFKGDLESEREILEKYSHDASLLMVRPKLVLFPKDSEDVKNLVKWVGDNCVRQDLAQKYGKLSITPRCAGTDMSGGAIGESIILDFTRYMNHLVKFMDDIPQASRKQKTSPQNSSAFGEKSFTITVQPGMFYRDFEKITLEKGLILPCYTASKSLNAMGGMYGNNSAGERTLKYGKTEDYILSAKIVFADGIERVVKSFALNEISKQEEIYKKTYELIRQNEEEIKRARPNVHKNSAGYSVWNVIRLKNSSLVFDLNKLLVGSQGTLGIVTEITFKLVSQTKHSKLVVIFMNDLAPLGGLVDEILALSPETLEAYDDKTMRLAVKFFPDFLKNKGFIGMLELMRSFLPEFGMMLVSGFPKLILLAEFAGQSENDVQKKCLELKNKIKGFKLKIHITKDENEANKYWNIRRESFALLRKHVRGMRTAPFIDDIIVRPEFLPKFLPELNSILKKYDLIYTLAGHAGDGNFHIIPLMDFSRPDTSRIILELSDKVYDLVLRYHGSITAEHNDGLIRTPYLNKMYSPAMLQIFKKIKEIFDPKNIFNPGKKIPTQNQGGTKEYITKHIAAEHKITHRV
ncbi:hypothetical protein A3D42_00240 [Candidatus Nomurabacteria bacterium RIFCSPHIGHO2_02_FULL_41_18]|uniref:D-lactate dehydrogenase (cytochrome) n=1 Tax=Candidatus Nomurabacteria bacterium RIFCSPHIGHO2_02_FULL_41_18 TaxID=1801754 RepID=A0A1F6W7R2_9BACT|nr:MAG: hypothetical protein A2737_02480 [Candidatus Nomurabacteria bacterium RIFCSPHIGHO2_01_FULL_41_71]OGI77931.1 MAG: hypothetical protein A3D42_00240 [Candidatus Nomurabacteria bacterium RIFCSPHIGHO2_02_FULL_41_18]OGI89577.1 MAG: hypothetical protein A3B01_00295 [Candidatus Nomurabacteria bacterium RIFCSPLOWO2_01_FULL_41_52b]OGJ00163.1 MAG: hypothetical protein A3I90_00165 [Candidatus Nomurabacteria bacterium RIFCSPLOWO2_02_FULL_41_9]